MDNELRFDNPLPDDVLSVARELYAAPESADYWGSLETRIMAGVVASQAAQTGQRSHATIQWSRTALAAAAAVLIAIGALVLHSHAAEIRAAYNSLVKPTPTQSLSVPEGALGAGDVQQGTLKDAIRH